jgi:hypothetical protein
MNKAQAPLLACHYTLGTSLLGILKNGHILPAEQADTPVIECPLAWFSLSQQHDPSALKQLALNGVPQAPTLEVMRQLGNGVYRLGLPPRALLGGEALRRQARVSKERWQALLKQAKACGADASQWYASVDPVPASDCVIEALQDGMKWVRVAS